MNLCGAGYYEPAGPVVSTSTVWLYSHRPAGRAPSACNAERQKRTRSSAETRPSCAGRMDTPSTRRNARSAPWSSLRSTRSTASLGSLSVNVCYAALARAASTAAAGSMRMPGPIVDAVEIDLT